LTSVDAGFHIGISRAGVVLDPAEMHVVAETAEVFPRRLDALR
jgi:hypothetical protein